MPIPRSRLRLTPEELDELLAGSRSLHAATVSPDGWPHVVPLWFVWLGGDLWVNNLRKSKRSRDMAAGSPVALCVDQGETYSELRGAVLYGRFEAAAGDARLDEVRAAFARKYWGLDSIPETRSHDWLVFRRERAATWDFRKIPAGADPRGGRASGT